MWARGAWVAALSLVGAACCAAGCASDLREEPLGEQEIWGTTVESRQVQEPIDLRQRGPDAGYGLPAPDAAARGLSSVADLIAVMPSSPLGADDADLFIADSLEFATDQCRGGTPQVIDALPMTIEAVVTLHPRRYFKVPVCRQDERNYGAYTIEDDTGGIVVLRDGRTTPFTFGDRVRLTVHAAMLTFGGDVDTRAVLVADVEVLPPLREPDGEGGERQVKPVYFAPTQVGFSARDVAQVRQVTGNVHVVPTNDNFNTMVLTDGVYPQAGEAAGGDATCLANCAPACARSCGTDEDPRFTSAEARQACDGICLELCSQGGAFDPLRLPGCWIIGIDAELGRRGLSGEVGQRVRVTGPVINSFDYQLQVMSLGQIEFLE